MTHELSAQQEAILAWFGKDAINSPVDVEGNLVGRARAGTGKTFIIVEGAKIAPERSIIIGAFSKIIQLELESRFTQMINGRKVDTHPHIKRQTIHSIGLSCITRFREGLKIDFGSGRADMLTNAVCGMSVPDAVMKQVTKLHTKARELAPFAYKVGDLTDLALEFECEPDEQWANSGFPLEKVEALALEAMELASTVKSGSTIDGTDMLFLPVRNGWIQPRYDMGVIDEAQDMTLTKLLIMRGIVKPTGRIAVFGDDRQAIFGFLGAKSESLDELKAELNAGELGLNTTYRCGKCIVRVAQQYVPDIVAGPNNPEGRVSSVQFADMFKTAGPSDYILSRTNLPLINIALKLLRLGKRTRIAGADIGRGLISLVRKTRARSVPDFLQALVRYETKETTRLEKMRDAEPTEKRKESITAKMLDVAERVNMLVDLATGAKSVTEIETRITELFQDDGRGTESMITCSSVHKAKGLEAKRIFILENTLRDYNIEEQNICYVAITRAKEELFWVSTQERED